ncbi:MAG: AAA family ATPase, partial [Oligosphaeraceae bacterium]
MKDLTSSSYTFEKLIRGNFLYVDKTEYIWKLVRPATGLYFLSRPRRFGKSLTLSTLKAVFEGRRELFRGLAIGDKQTYDWKPYPVIHLNLGNCDARTPEDLREYLAHVLRQACSDHDIKVDVDRSQLAASFEGIIRALARDSQAVVLVDEYDKPILNVLGTEQAQDCLDVLKGLYSSIKACEPQERFVLVTGVSKFSHVSMFSELNNLTDLSMHPDFATMLGYTQEELEAAFDKHIDKAAQRLEMPRGQLLGELKEWYDGYRFHPAAKPVYNPVSVARFFDGGCEFDNYWY